MQKFSPTFLQIISTDYLAQNYFVMIFAGWVIYAIDAVFGGKAVFFLAIFASICTLLGLLLFFRRYDLIISTFLHGIEIEGRVTEVTTISAGKKTRDYIIHYQYDFNGRNHQYRNRVKQNSFAQTVKQGQPVTLLASEKTPQIAFIKEVYLEDHHS